MTTFQAAFVDLDGTVYRGDKLVPDAAEGIRTLQAAGVDVLFLSNKAIERRSDYVAKLEDLRIEASHDRVANSGWVTARYAAEHRPKSEASILGEEPSPGHGRHHRRTERRASTPPDD